MGLVKILTWSKIRGSSGISTSVEFVLNDADGKTVCDFLFPGTTLSKLSFK